MESIVEIPHAFGINSAILFSGLVLVFVGGYLADLFGPKGRVPLMLAASLGLGIMAPIFLNLIGDSGDPLLAFFLQFTMACLMGTIGGSMIP